MSASPVALTQRVQNIKHLNTHGMRQQKGNFQIIDEEEKSISKEQHQ